jgi:diacylglycerol kinase
LGGLEWTILLIAGGLFLAVELMNTAMERLVDTLDDYQKQLLGSHFHLGLKMAKDVASGASLVSLTIVIAVILIILLPHLTPIVRLLLHA